MNINTYVYIITTVCTGTRIQIYLWQFRLPYTRNESGGDRTVINIIEFESLYCMQLIYAFYATVEV